jgi:hypothetical protein
LHGDTLFAAIVLVHVGYLMVSRTSRKGSSSDLRDAFSIAS